MAQPDLRQQHFRTARVDAADNGAARLYEATPDPKMPYIKGAQQIVGGILNKAQQVYETQREAERQSDIIAAKAEYHKREQLAWEKIQNATVGGDDASLEGLEKVVEQTFAEMDEEYSEWMQQHTKGGILNVRAAETRAELDLYRQQRLADAQLKATGYLYNKRREETVNRFNIGLEEAIADSGPEAETAVKGIATAMRASGFDPEQVRVKEEAALQTVSMTRLERDLQNLQSKAYDFTTQEEVRSLDDEFKALEQALTPGSELHEASGYRHLTPAQLEKAKAAIPQARKEAVRNVKNNISDKQFFEQMKYLQKNKDLYVSHFTGGESEKLTQEKLNLQLTEGKITPEIHSQWSGILESERSKQQDAEMDVAKMQMVRALKNGDLQPETFRNTIDQLRANNQISSDEYESLNKEIEAGTPHTDQIWEMLTNPRPNMVDRGKFLETVNKARQSGEISLSQADEYRTMFLPKNDEQRKLVQIELDRIGSQIKLVQAGKGTMRYGIYTKESDDPELFKTAREDVISDPFNPNIKSDYFKYVEMTPPMVVNYYAKLLRWAEKNPNGDEVALREYSESLIEGISTEQARNKYRFIEEPILKSERANEGADRYRKPSSSPITITTEGMDEARASDQVMRLLENSRRRERNY